MAQAEVERLGGQTQVSCFGSSAVFEVFFDSTNIRRPLVVSLLWIHDGSALHFL